ncbi:MAG TPA: carbohydrate-binding module family 20 domain-containing protein [Bacteroidota bacterium]|nr:carbohydrate-binding module family 20 domain-containing protein [Bacteroidota bacterium]
MKRRSILLFLATVFAALSAHDAHAQPRVVPGGVEFALPDSGYTSVVLVGDFNGWSKDTHPMRKSSSNAWVVTVAAQPGMYQYLFFVDGKKYLTDPNNPVAVENYNRSGQNSVFVLTAEGTVQLTATRPLPSSNPNDAYPQQPDRKPVYLNIIWHQHQPLYLNPATDQLEGPWVRTHATKDYYDMAAILERYPDVHCNINLTSSLLYQLDEYYVKRLKPFVNLKKNTINAKGFLRSWKGKTDPWIDLMLKPTAEFDSSDVARLLHNTWNAFGISEVMIERFPQYQALKERLATTMRPGMNPFTEQEMREIKFFFYLAHFDPDFLTRKVNLPDGLACDLSDLVRFDENEKEFFLKRTVTEEDCRRLLVEAYKVMASVIPQHRRLRYDPSKRTGQIDIITTPFYHPILPLIYDSDIARVCQPGDKLPPRFSFPKDAEAQVAKAVTFYRRIFGATPTGMWPAEGAVAQEILPILRKHGVWWAATDVQVLQRSTPTTQPNTSPYRLEAGRAADGSPQWMALVFRDTELSDRIGFRYQNYRGEEAAEDFVQTILARAPKQNEPDVLVTVILDGENAWEWYRHDIDGKEFLHALYRKLSKLFTARQVITTTMAEYIAGNPSRGIPPHPLENLPPLERLWPGSWINANYDTWIGEEEENAAWRYLLQARNDLEASNLKQPDPFSPLPKKGTRDWYAAMAYEAIYAAEGSDWFWWYGSDQSAPAGDGPFDEAFRTHLRNVYEFARKAGATMPVRSFAPILLSASGGGPSAAEGGGVMARGGLEMQDVLFTVDASGISVPDAVYIVGNRKELGEWIPNSIRMYDDGSHGDVKASDGIWSLRLRLPVGTEVQYKYTNSGRRGEWIPGEEFPSNNRIFIVTNVDSTIIIADIFGKK